MQIYKESRTLIIEKYRESPKQRLEFPAVKEAVARSGISTDYEGLRRIYEFLDAWGLINYEASDGAGHSLGSLPPVVAASGVPPCLVLVSWYFCKGRHFIVPGVAWAGTSKCHTL